MAHRQDAGSAFINRLDTAMMRADYAAWLADQLLSTRTREAYLAAVTAFVAWLEQRDAGPGAALVAPRGRDLAARDYKRHMRALCLDLVEVWRTSHFMRSLRPSRRQSRTLWAILERSPSRSVRSPH